ncbi:MAG TPA: hypothetical protein DGG95_15995 [Cytophagales bacterium]|jgi:nitrite reductase/ring-hydroxylating ferredoxin subunit|nr:hypothetical protein [Cytophagales bacterium]
MKKNKFKIIITALLLWGSTSAFSQIAFPTITINLNYPQFQRLKLDGGFVYVEGSWKGIILYRQNDNTYLAYERACSHHPNDPCGLVQVDGSSLFMICNCCRSSFNFSDGQPMGGPASRPLIQYRIDLDGSTLKISDEIIN